MQLARLFRTVRHLRPVQITNRLRRRLIQRHPMIGPAGPMRPLKGTVPSFVPRRGGWDGSNGFNLLGLPRVVIHAGDWNASDAPKLWLYHLHYFEDLLRPNAEAWRERHASLIQRWIAENPPLIGNGWEPYPIALRSIFWIKWALSGGLLDTSMRDSLALQLRHLENNLEFHLLGNHLWADAKALFVAGLFFEGAEAERWYQRGLALLECERVEQILADGGHFERSPVYHCLILEDVLDLIALARCYGRPLRGHWEDTATRMLDWLATMTRPDGKVVAWNDAADNAAPLPAALFDYASSLGVNRPSPPSGLRHLQATGYVRADHGRFILWFDAGPIGPDYIPGHAHADTLNIELVADGRPLFVDTGTSTYDIGSRRTYERGTSAHNSVVIDGRDSSEIWGGFRVGRRARPQDISVTPQRLSVAHDGYQHIGAMHRRTIDLSRPNVIVLQDQIEGRSGSGATARFHLAPGQKPRLDDTRVSVGTIVLDFTGASAIRIETCEIAAGFNQLNPSFCIAADFSRDLITKITQ